MKNIHILPTDKPSKLYLGDNGNFVFGLIQSSIKSKNNNYTNQNIYITSDEKIKEGDWIYSFVDNKIYKIVYSKNNIIQSFYHSHYLNESKKIILTTDLELQKDGVQAIDDEFLEWFVKNTSCETIKVNHYGTCCGNSFISQCINCEKYKPVYKIIIPKEEPKQCDICKRYPRLEGTNKCESCYSVVRHVLEQDPRFKNTLLPDLRKKEETLEEAAERIYPNEGYKDEAYCDLGEMSRELWLEGAKWQAEKSDKELEVAKHLYLTALKEKEQMCTKEDMWESYKESNTIFGDEIALRQEFEEWFEKFKKK